MSQFSNLSNIVYKRTYSRKTPNGLENWDQIVDRYVAGNVQGHEVPEEEIKTLLRLGKERKAVPAGRGLWFSGSPIHSKIGASAAVNCWFFNADDWQNYVLAQDMLMLGGGVGMSVEHRNVSKLPKIKKDVVIEHKASKDADFIVPDSREGWCELTRRVLESWFNTGRSFTYSTVCLRGYGEPIAGFGGVASGPIPLIKFVNTLCSILRMREGKHIRPVDAADIICATGEMVVAGNVRRSAIIILGDPWDKEYLTSKRWDLGAVPNYRACANYTVVCDDVEDLHASFWKTYENGEPFGIFNRKAAQKYGRMGDLKKDTGVGTNPCAEIVLESGEACNLVELSLMNIKGQDEFNLAARTMFNYAKRVTMDHYHHPVSAAVIARNRRIGVGITGCLGSANFHPESLDRAYKEIQAADIKISDQYNIPRSIRTTTVKPSGTVSKVLDQGGYEGIHPAFSRYMIQRIRFSADDALIPVLKAAGHYMEPVQNFDGSLNNGTLVVDFYIQAPNGMPVADEDWDTWKQLSVVQLAQKHWSDNSVSVTVYYKKEEIPQLKEWLANNLSSLKSISFLCHSDHGFKQAPKEAISKEQYEKLSSKIKYIDVEGINEGEIDGSLECASGICPIK